MGALITKSLCMCIIRKSQVRPDVLIVATAISGELIPNLGRSRLGNLLTLAKLHMILIIRSSNAIKGRIGAIGGCDRLAAKLHSAFLHVLQSVVYIERKRSR